MTISLTCFCKLLLAKTPERRSAIIEQYKKQATAPVRGRCVYYLPALRLVRGTLCAGGTVTAKLASLRDVCIRPKSPTRLNDARIMNNARVFRMFHSEFGDKKLEVFSSPRLQFQAGPNVAVNLQPDLFARIDGTLMMWKFGMLKKPLPDHVISAVLQMMASAAKAKGLEVSIQHFRYLDTTSGAVHWESTRDNVLTGTLKAQARSMADLWRKVG